MEDFTTWTEGAVVKEDLLKKLRDGVVEVVFTKKDESTRTMRCTLNMDMIPEEDHPKGTGSPGPETIMKVYELEKGWRSFSVDRILSIDGEDMEGPVTLEA